MSKPFTTRACLSPQEVQDYLGNQLSESDRFAIEDHLLDCPLCEAALEGLSQADPQTSAQDFESIQKELNIRIADKKSEKEARVLSLNRYRNWIAAAAIIVFLVSAGILYQSKGPLNNQELYAQHHSNYESPFVGTRSGSASEGFLEKGLASFHQEDYSQALAHFEEAISEEETDWVAQLHAGVSALELGSSQKAKDHLMKARLNAPLLYGPATWYLALTQLAEGEISACRETLLQISEAERSYHENAKELLAQLPRLK
ncbi:MAG: hypothetical protein HKN16_03240 [Saprospiraceae bacterium]|nr:hypothetical protein [Saprospiraceae bacterium]